ncbi:MAG: hypothetical protein AVDCRST_MAG59-4331, partial [uncultured Thermomicrobiales bacterium]
GRFAIRSADAPLVVAAVTPCPPRRSCAGRVERPRQPPGAGHCGADGGRLRHGSLRRERRLPRRRPRPLHRRNLRRRGVLLLRGRLRAWLYLLRRRHLLPPGRRRVLRLRRRVRRLRRPMRRRHLRQRPVRHVPRPLRRRLRLLRQRRLLPDRPRLRHRRRLRVLRQPVPARPLPRRLLRPGVRLLPARRDLPRRRMHPAGGV